MYVLHSMDAHLSDGDRLARSACDVLAHTLRNVSIAFL